MTFHPTNNPLFWQQTADTCFAQERFEKAAEAYLRLAELAPNDVDAWKGRGKALLALDRAADAAGCFERALLLVPDDEELLTLLADALDRMIFTRSYNKYITFLHLFNRNFCFCTILNNRCSFWG